MRDFSKYGNYGSNYEFNMLSSQSSSFALTFSSRDRVIYVYAKIGFVAQRPVFYFDIKDYIVLERNDKPKPQIDEASLMKAVIKKGSENFESFYIRTDDKEDYFVTVPVETHAIKESHQTVCLPLIEKITPIEDYFESERSY